MLVGILLTSTINIDPLLATFPPLARLLRQPYWNGIITLIGYLLLLSQLRSRIAIIAAVIIPAVFYGPIFFSGNMWGYWCASTPPQSYELLPSFEGKALWIPGMGDFRAQWVRCGGPSWTSASAWRPTGIVEIRSWGGPALSLTYTGLFSQYFAYFNYLNYSGLPFATVSLDPRVAYGVVGISYVGVVYDRAFSGDLRRALQEAGVFFSRAGEEVVSSSELTVVKLGDATLCRIGGFLTLTGGYPALGALFSAFGWRAPPAVFSLFNASAVQGGDGVDGVPAAVVKFTAFKRQGLARGTGIVYDSFYREVAARGGIWPFDYITDFLYGDSGVAYGVVELPGGTYDVYVRGYVSNISGVLTLRLGSVEYNISLKADVARFRWIRVGRLLWEGGRLEVVARFSGGLVAVGELAFVKPVEGGPKRLYIYTPYDLPGPKYRDAKSPLGLTVDVSGLFKVPGEGEYVVYIHLARGVVLGPGGIVVGNGAVVRGGDLLDFVKARVSYIIFVRKDWLEEFSVRNASCQGAFRVSSGEFVQYNVLYDSSWELRCNSSVYKPVTVYGLVAGFYVERGGMCQLYYSLYDVQKVSFLVTVIYIFILSVCLVLWRKGLCRLLYLRKTPLRPSR
nr:hypothetical protein [Pyrobaculum sp.]